MKCEPRPDQIEDLERLHRASRFLDVHERLETHTPPETWESTQGRVVAGRAIGNLGANARSRRLLLSTWRRDPADSAARYFMVLDYHGRHGPVETLRLLDSLMPEQSVPQSGGTSEGDVWLGLLRARSLAQCRDFEAAEIWLNAGLETLPDSPWVHVERAMCLEQADHYPEALEAAQRALTMRPGYARALWHVAHLLMLTNRDDEALALLRRESATSQSAYVPLQLGGLLLEHEQFSEALAAFELAGARAPMKEKALDDFLRSRRADLLHRLGREAEAGAAARGLRGRYWEIFSARLAEPLPEESGVRLQLAVPFVRQHHVTCVPATLSAVSAFLGHPVDHLALARVITYDGTPDHEERHWLEAHGWHVREFRVTWEVAAALLDRGIPFTLVTTWTASAHLQAVVGYDPRIGSLIIRDPYHRETHEVLGAELLEQQAPFGPRGMVLVPQSEIARIADLPLPDAVAYDHWFRLRRALVAHDRMAAAEAAQRLDEIEPEGRLAWWARRQLAYYDDNPARALTAVTALRKLFPTEPNLQLEELSLFSRLGRRTEHRERVGEILAKGKADPAIWREQVDLWRADAREHRRALRLARRFLRVRPYDWSARWTMAHVLWDGREFGAATKLYRLAACGGDKVEAAWQAYFAAARHGGRAMEALALLRAREQRLGAASSLPAVTLARALEQIDQTPEARAVLEAAKERRREDGDVLISLALLTGRTGDAEAAAGLLAIARPHVASAEWHRTAAQLAAWRADHAEARDHHEAVLAENPLEMGSLGETARLRAVTIGLSATLEWLAECVARHPHFLPLRQLRLTWLRDRPASEALAEVAEFLALEPAHAWALREQALILLRAGRPAEALASAKLAEEIEPRIPQSAGIVGQVLLAQREFALARAATERALRLDIAADWLMAQLIEACPEFGERAAAVAFMRGELERQPAPVTGFLRFREAAVGVLSPETLWSVLEGLRAGQAERWEPWSACVQQAIALNRADTACAIAQQAAEKFPLVPRAWLDLADAHRLASDQEAEAAALARARELSPGWRDVAFRLASLHQRRLQLDDALQVLQAALAHDPLDAGLQGRLADLLWRSGRRDEALVAVERAAEAAPAWSEPWAFLAEWSRERGEPARVVEFARRVASSRAGDAHARRQLARVLCEQGDNLAALAEATSAAELAPLDTDNHDLRVYVLTLLGRRDEALAACAPAATGSPPPLALQGREAWVRWQFGERKAAIAAMNGITQAHPDYVWGWQLLAEWHGAMDENNRAAQAAEKYAELRPDSATAWGWVASFKLKAHDTTGAAPVLERALRLDPGYDYAAFQLLKLSCEFSRWDQAERTLALIRQHASRWHALRCETMYFRMRRDQPAAVRNLDELCSAPGHETLALTEAANELTTAGWNEAVEKALRGALVRPDCNAEAGAIWMRARLERRTSARPRVRWLEKSGATEPVRQAAWRVYIEWLGQHKSTGVLRWHLWRRGQWLASNDATWGTVGFVLTNLSWHRRRARWMADWRERKNVEPWMLSNLAHALMALDRSEELAEVVAGALRLPVDHTRASFVAWAARAAAAGGRFDEAAQLLGTFENYRNNEFATLAAEQARAIMDVAGAEPELRREKFAEVRQTMAQARRAHGETAAVTYVARDHRRALRDAARLAKSPWRWWYAIPLPVGHSPGENISTLGALGLIVLLIVAVIGIVATGAPAGVGVMFFFLARALTEASRKKQ